MNSHSRIEALLEFLREDPDDAATKYMLALEYIKSGNDEEAMKWMMENYQKHIDYLPNYYHLGKLLERKGEKSEAKKVFIKGTEIARLQRDLHTLQELDGAIESMD